MFFGRQPESADASTRKSGQVDFRHLYTAGYMVRVGLLRTFTIYSRYEKFQKELVGPAQALCRSIISL